MKSPDEDLLESVSSVIIHGSHFNFLIMQLLGRQINLREGSNKAEKQRRTTEQNESEHGAV